jgi:diadenosine tetraphosphate (Ap4A) HIT family hydrolase
MHATLEKFGYPAALVADFTHWCVLLRPQQATLGALVLASKSEATAFSQLPAEALIEFGQVVAAIESVLASVAAYDKINYLMLMMLDPHVHMHVLPRYAAPKHFEGVTFTDPGWPGVPDLKYATAMPDEARRKLQTALKEAFRSAC